MTLAVLGHWKCVIFLESISFQVLAWSWVECWRLNSHDLNCLKNLKCWTKVRNAAVHEIVFQFLRFQIEKNEWEEWEGKGHMLFSLKTHREKKWFSVHNTGLLHTGSFQGRNLHLGRAGGCESLSRVVVHAWQSQKLTLFGICEVSWNVRLSGEPLHSCVYSLCLRKRWGEGLARVTGAERIWI